MNKDEFIEACKQAAEDGLNLTELSERLGVSKQAVHARMRLLVNKGYDLPSLAKKRRKL